MILGLGSDITDARRIAKVIERHGERFLTRIFTDIERSKAERRKNRAETYAKRFAAKEACAKARLDALAPEGHAIDIHLTMTDDHPWAQAFVILTARKLER